MTDDVDLDRVTRLIAHRCGDALTPGDLAMIEAALNGRDAEPMGEIAELIVDVLDAMESRLAALEEKAA